MKSAKHTSPTVGTMADLVVGFFRSFGGGDILSELTVKCLIGFGRFLIILEDQWKWENVTIIVNVQHNMVLCRPEDCLVFLTGQGDCSSW
jgi:hypothetical protein